MLELAHPLADEPDLEPAPQLPAPTVLDGGNRWRNPEDDLPGGDLDTAREVP